MAKLLDTHWPIHSGEAHLQHELLQGFAYVEFESTQGLQRAVDMTGVDFQGRNLKISISNQPIGGGRAPTRGGRGPPRGQQLDYNLADPVLIELVVRRDI